MVMGVIIAKDGSNINSPTDELYVDPATSLLKVARTVSGIFSHDGTGFTTVSSSPYQWVKRPLAFVGATQYYSIDIPVDDLGIDYAPQFVAYLDQVNNSRRMQLGGLIGGINNEGDLSGFTNAITVSAVDGQKWSVGILASFVAAAIPGNYGYFIQIYYDRARSKRAAS